MIAEKFAVRCIVCGAFMSGIHERIPNGLEIVYNPKENLVVTEVVGWECNICGSYFWED